jgi:hypothetical protein
MAAIDEIMGNYWLMRIQANVIRKHKKFIESMN